MADRAEGPDRVAKHEEGRVEAKQRKKESIPSLSNSSSLPPLTYSLIQEAKLTIAR